MSTVVILAPIIIGGWPAISAAVAGAAAALGLLVKESVKQHAEQEQGQVEQQVEVEVEGKVLVENLATDKEIILVKGDIELRISRDERGRCKVCAKAKGRTKAELEQMADEFVEKMTQCFVYNRVASELKSKGFQVVNEEVMKDQSIRIQVRRWVD